MKELEILKSILASNFQYSYYEEAIKNIRNEIIEFPHYKENLNDIIKMIIYRKLQKGEPLEFIQNSANLVLYENTDDEAYRWLDLFLINILNENEVIPYEI
jgi:hypothetical protein